MHQNLTHEDKERDSSENKAIQSTERNERGEAGSALENKKPNNSYHRQRNSNMHTDSKQYE